jgi:hypothetical protein
MGMIYSGSQAVIQREAHEGAVKERKKIGDRKDKKKE